MRRLALVLTLAAVGAVLEDGAAGLVGLIFVMPVGMFVAHRARDQRALRRHEAMKRA